MSKLIETVKAVDYHRNGVGGAGFHTVEFVGFDDTFTGKDRDFVATIFDADGHVAVITPDNMEHHWRGDNFETELRAIVNRDTVQRAIGEGKDTVLKISRWTGLPENCIRPALNAILIDTAHANQVAAIKARKEATNA